MEESIIPISQVTRGMTDWTTRVTITEEMPLMICKGGKHLKRYVFTDEEGTEIIGSVFGSAVTSISAVLELFKVYDISNAEVRDVPEPYRVLPRTDEWRLSPTTPIRPLPHIRPTMTYLLHNLTPFNLLRSAAIRSDQAVEVIGVVIEAHGIEDKVTESGPCKLQKFTLINTEREPMHLSLWGKLIDNAGPPLEAAARKFSVVIARRLSFHMYDGIQLRAKNSSSFTFDPPIDATAELKSWFDMVRDLELKNFLSSQSIVILRENVYNGTARLHTASEIKSSSENGEYWIRGNLQIADEDQSLYYIACNSCSYGIKSRDGREYYCIRCKKNVVATMRSLVHMTISDDTRVVKVSALDTLADQILQTTAINIGRLLRAGTPYDLDPIKAEFQGRWFLALIRRTYGKRYDGKPRLVLLAYYPDEGNAISSSNADFSTPYSPHESTSGSLSLSPLKRQFNQCIINPESGTKRQLTMKEGNPSASIQHHVENEYAKEDSVKET